jgi:ammonium transporter Rh
MVDIQNATLAGGVAVGAVADLMLQPYGALVAGTVVGIISTLGFKKLQVRTSMSVQVCHSIP